MRSSRSSASARRSGRSHCCSATRWDSRSGEPGGTLATEGLPARRKEFSPRWILDGMIRTGPMGDRYLPWSSGWILTKLARHPHVRAVGALRTGIVGEKLMTPTSASISERDHIAREAGVVSFASVRRRRPAFPFRLVGRRDNRSNNSCAPNAELMRGEPGPAAPHPPGRCAPPPPRRWRGGACPEPRRGWSTPSAHHRRDHARRR